MSVPAGQMLALLSQMSPDQVQGILGLGNAPEQQAMLLQQLQQARALQSTPEPEGRGFGYGKIYTAPSPLEVLGSNLMKYIGYQKAGNISAAQQALLGQQTQQRGNYFDLLRRALLAGGSDPSAGGSNDPSTTE